MNGLVGVTVIVSSVADPTVRLVDPVTEPVFAEIVVVPTVPALASPEEPMVAADALAELQVTAELMSAVLPSE
jgi:hypothetical protein